MKEVSVSKKLIGITLLLTTGIAALGWGSVWISPAQPYDAEQSVKLAPPFWISYYTAGSYVMISGPLYCATRFVPTDFAITYPFKIVAVRSYFSSGRSFQFLILNGADHSTILHASPTQTGLGTATPVQYDLPTPLTIASGSFDVVTAIPSASLYGQYRNSPWVGRSYYSTSTLMNWTADFRENYLLACVDTTQTGPGPGGDYDVAIVDWFFDPQATKQPYPGVDNLPVCEIMNQVEDGDTPGPVTVNCWIYDSTDVNLVYSGTAEVPQLASRAVDYAKFWDPFVPGSTYRIVFEIDSASVPEDANFDNNRWEEYIETVMTKDIVVIKDPVKPADDETLYTNAAITPKIGIANNAVAEATNFMVYFKAGAYLDSVLVPSLAAGAFDSVEFNPWTPADAGPVACQFIAALVGDEDPKNDTAVVNVTVMLGVGETKPALPNHFGITAVTPNPFSTTTSIEFQLPVNTAVSLKTYDVSGNLVKTLVNGRTEAGVKTAVWDGKDNSGRPVPKGVYFVRMDTPEYSATNKLILVR